MTSLKSLKRGTAAVALALSVLAAPFVAEAKTVIRIQSVIPSSADEVTMLNDFAADVLALTDGEVEFQVLPAGAVVGVAETLDAVDKGLIEAGFAWTHYWSGKHPAAMLFGSPVAGAGVGIDNIAFVSWFMYGGGQELWDELAGQFGLKNVMAGNTGCQMGGWFRKEINSADDLKGLKMRIPGLGGDVMAKLGASPVSLPGGQIYENLVSGAIDATEWVGPWNDRFMKFYEAAKYYYYPGMHEPGSMLAMGMNASFWSGLSKSDQVMIEAAATVENDVMMSEYNAKSGDALLDLIANQGVQLRKFSDDTYDSFGEAAEEVFDEVRAHGELANNIYESFAKSRANVGAWSKISDQAFVDQRNRVLGF